MPRIGRHQVFAASQAEQTILAHNATNPLGVDFPTSPAQLGCDPRSPGLEFLWTARWEHHVHLRVMAGEVERPSGSCSMRNSRIKEAASVFRPAKRALRERIR